jgi:hypothetical protein
MVRIIVAAAFLLVITLPAMAQDDFPRVEMSLGYGNIGFGFPGLGEDPENPDASSRHSGFVSTQGFNFTNWLGLENNLGYYSVGNNISLISNVFGGKAALRLGGRAVPFGFAGIGGGYLTSESSGYGYSGFNTRVGVGLDYALSDTGMGLRFDLSRLGTRFGGISSGNTSFSVSISFALMN